MCDWLSENQWDELTDVDTPIKERMSNCADVFLGWGLRNPDDGTYKVALTILTSQMEEHEPF